jgi:hypothetical protein
MIKEIIQHNKIRFLANLWVVVLTLFIGFNLVSAAGSWDYVGSAGFSKTEVYDTVLKLDSSNTPYVIFAHKNYGSVTVMKYDGSSWSAVGGAPVFSGNVLRSSLVFDTNDVPYVAYQDVSNQNKLNVVKYDATSSKWVNVGNAGFAKGHLYGASLVFDSKNVPYLAFTDAAKSDSITVMKYDGSKWVTVGSAGFSTWGATWMSISIDSNDVPYVSFTLISDSGKITVMKFNGTKWVNVGSSGFSSINAQYVSLELDSKSSPYVAFTDNNDKATVMKYDGSKWVTVGSAGFSSTTAWYTSLAIDVNDTPYVAFSRMNSSADSIEVMKYDGSKWVMVGTSGFSNAGAWYTSLSFDSNNILYVAFCDGFNNRWATVMKNEDAKKSWSDSGTTKSISGNSEITSVTTDTPGNKYVAFSDSDYGDKATVLKYDGVNKWSPVGPKGFTPDRADWVSLAMDKNNVPYIAFSDSSVPDMGSFGKASVMKFNGTKWVNVGTPGFSVDGAQYTRLAFDKNNVPYITYVDAFTGTLSTMKLDTSSIPTWVPVGVAGYSRGVAWYPSMVFDNLNMPYVAFREQTTGMAMVMKYDGGTWQVVGANTPSLGSVDSTEIKFDSNNELYIAYMDWTENGKITVMKLDSRIASWVPVGTAGFTKEESYGSSLEIYNNVPYVSFSYVAAYSGKTEDGVVVMKYDSTLKRWGEVGEAPMADPNVYTDIVIDRFGVPFVSLGGDPVTIMKFD